MKTAELKLTQAWDKTFPQSDKVDHCKVTFINRYGITLAADMYVPKNVQGKLPAIAVCGPFGAVKEQCSGLYAQNMAERGFLTIAFDPSFTGERDRYYRYLRLGRHGAEHRRARYTRQGDRCLDHVRYDPRERERLLRLRGQRGEAP